MDEVGCVGTVDKTEHDSGAVNETSKVSFYVVMSFVDEFCGFDLGRDIVKTELWDDFVLVWRHYREEKEHRKCEIADNF